MKQKLQHVDELTVKYALNDLEPTEAALLDEAMHNDQDVLIEAESQRRTWARVCQLPRVDAPAGLLDDTVRMAVAARRKPEARILPFTPMWRWVAAASILVVAALPFMRGSDTVSLPTADVRIAAPDSQPVTQPWIDNQDVIRLQDATAKVDSVVKLVPVDPNTPTISGASARQLQQTGNRRTP